MGVKLFTSSLQSVTYKFGLVEDVLITAVNLLSFDPAS